jgi:hypothetical protein
MLDFDSKDSLGATLHSTLRPRALARSKRTPDRDIHIWALLLSMAFGCAGPIPEPADHPVRIEKAAEGLEGDPAIEAAREGIAAARAREEETGPIDEFELRLGQRDFESSDVRVLARVPVKRSKKMRAERDVLRAETEIAISKLEEMSLERRAELCFPSVDALAYFERERIYSAYADRQGVLLTMNREWRESGMINELRAARFELESRTHLTTWKPSPVRIPDQILGSLPEFGDGNRGMKLVLDPDLLEQTVEQHHPSVGLRRATAEHYRAMSEHARAGRMPWLQFFDISYEHRSGAGDDDRVGGQVSFSVPLGGRSNAGFNRYKHLAHQEASEAEVLVREQVIRSLEALGEIQEFEASVDRLQELETLAARAEAIAERWRDEQLGEPPAVSALLDEAFSARNAVVDARERAGIAGCALLAMSGVTAQEWPREEVDRE